MPSNPHGKKWLATGQNAQVDCTRLTRGHELLNSRRPEVYREQKKVNHQLSMDDAFLRFLDQMEERAQLEKARDAPKMIEGVTVVEVEQGDGSDPGALPDLQRAEGTLN
jgi:hypothetical protein